MYITVSTIITVASLLTALGVILGVVLKVHKWYLKQEEQSVEIAEIKNKEKEDIHRLKQENALICFGLSACLDGLQQLGANHTVPVAKERLDNYLNDQAHE